MTDLLTAAKAIDELWSEPDPGTEDAVEGRIWLADFEDDGIPRSLADALRDLRRALPTMGIDLATGGGDYTAGRPGSREALTSLDALRSHEPGESHRYQIECEVCGQRGVIRLSVDPERVAGEGSETR